MPRATATVPRGALAPAAGAGLRAREGDIVIPLQSRANSRGAVRPVSESPANPSSIVLAWPAQRGTTGGFARPSPFAALGGMARPSGTPLLRPVVLSGRRASSGTFALVTSSGVVFGSRFGAGPAFFGSPFFCDRFGFAAFGFDPFFFSIVSCPFCGAPSLGLPLLSVDTLGFGPAFFFEFSSRPFFRRRFFGPRAFGPRAFRPQFFPGFFPAFVTEAEPVESVAAEVAEPDPAIIPSNLGGGAPSESESMAAAPRQERSRNALLVLQNNSTLTVADYWLGRDGRVHYVTADGRKDSVPLDRVDVFSSVRANLARGEDFFLDGWPHAATP